MEYSVDLIEQLAGTQFQHPTEPDILVHVDAPLASFHPADERLVFPVGVSEVGLRHAEFPPPRNEALDDLDVGLFERGLAGLRHGAGPIAGNFTIVQNSLLTPFTP